MPDLSTSLLNDLAAITGPDAITADQPPRVSPATTEELSRILAFASGNNLAVSPTGGGTKLSWGNPVTPQLLIDTRKLTGIREHIWQDLTCTVAAGATWSQLQAALAQHGQRVALDTIAADQATVGGILSTNDSGLLRLRYGSLRDLVLGCTIVLSDGTVARSGGKVVKNVAGYDLPKLVIGSFGTLGIITEVSFRLHPTQPHAASFTARSLEVAPLNELMKSALAASLSIERMQLRNESTSFALDIELASLPEVLAEQEQNLRKLAQTLTLETAHAGVWQVREQLATAGETLLKITTLPARLSPLIAGFAQLSQFPDHSFRAVADPAGIVTVACTAPAETLLKIIEELRERLRSTSGHCVVLNRGTLPPGVDAWGGTPAAIDVMRAIKQEFDPTCTLNPRKFVGGL